MQRFANGCHAKMVCMDKESLLSAEKKPCLKRKSVKQSPVHQARQRHINIHILVRLALGRSRVCPWALSWLKPRFSPQFTQWKPSFGGPKKSFNSKIHPKPSQEFSEQFGPFIHKIKGFSRNSPQKVHPNFAQNLGRQILGNTFLGLKVCPRDKPGTKGGIKVYVLKVHAPFSLASERRIAKMANQVRAACLQNETAPEKLLNRYEKRFEKRETRSEKRSETRPKSF